MNLALALLCAAPHVVVVQRSLISVPEKTADGVLAEVAARAGALVRPPCKRGVDCLQAAAAGDGVDVAIGVSLASSSRGVTVDLEAKGHTGEQLGTWTGTLPSGSTRLPADADGFFDRVLAVKAVAPEVHAVAAPPPEPLRPAKPLFIAGATAGIACLALSVGGVVMKGPLDQQLQRMPVITGLTREQANSQVATVNGLFTGSLIAGAVAIALLGAAVIALLIAD